MPNYPSTIFTGPVDRKDKTLNYCHVYFAFKLNLSTEIKDLGISSY